MAYDFPPYVSVGGLRPYSWFKYLHEYEFFPIVVTRQWNNKYGNHLDYIAPSELNESVIEKSEKGIILKTSYSPNLANRIMLKYGDSKFKLFRKSISAFYEFGQFMFLIGSKSNIYRATDKYLANNKVDLIIATGEPFILFKYASELGKKYSIPWIADYRDPWIQNKSITNQIYKAWVSFFERRLLNNVCKVITVSNFVKNQIEQNIKDKQFEIICNGYDPEIIATANDIKQPNDILTIGFAGTLYSWHPIESFLKICNEMLLENPSVKIRLNFYGINKENEIKKLLSSKYQTIERSVIFHSKVNNLELAKSLAKQNALLLFNDYSILGTKIFDYVASKRRIILCYENDENANKLKKQYYGIDVNKTESNRLQIEMITETNSGIIVKDSNNLKKVLLELNTELQQNGFIKCESINTEQFSRVRQVEKLAEVLKQIIQES